MESKPERKKASSRSIKAIKRDFEYLHKGWYLKVDEDAIYLLDKYEVVRGKMLNINCQYALNMHVPNEVAITFVNYANEILKDKQRRRKND